MGREPEQARGLSEMRRAQLGISRGGLRTIPGGGKRDHRQPCLRHLPSGDNHGGRNWGSLLSRTSPPCRGPEKTLPPTPRSEEARKVHQPRGIRGDPLPKRSPTRTKREFFPE